MAALNKYGAKRTKVDGLAFDSAGEARRWSELELLRRAGKITDLKRQVSYTLYGKGGTAVTKYRADFVYVEGGKTVVEDFKGVKPAIFKLKAKLFRDNYGFDITVTGCRR